MNPLSTLPKDGRKIFMFFRAPTNWHLTGSQVYWKNELKHKNKGYWAGGGDFSNDPPKYARGWIEMNVIGEEVIE